MSGKNVKSCKNCNECKILYRQPRYGFWRSGGHYCTAFSRPTNIKNYCNGWSKKARPDYYLKEKYEQALRDIAWLLNHFKN